MNDPMEVRLHHIPEMNGVGFELIHFPMGVEFVLSIEDATILSSKLAGIVLDSATKEEKK